jgi:hypothetical protein
MGQVFKDWSNLDPYESDDSIEDFDYEVLLNNNTLDQFENLMSKYKEWASIKRDIRLTNVFESGKRIQFDIESISMFGQFGNSGNILSLQMAVLRIKSMSFILKENKVEKLTLRCKVLETPMGKVVKELMENSMDIDLKLHIIDNKVVYFYVDTYENAA